MQRPGPILVGIWARLLRHHAVGVLLQRYPAMFHLYSVVRKLLTIVVSSLLFTIVPSFSATTFTDGRRRVALCYTRLSYNRDGEDATSPERQRANITTMLASSGLTLEWYEDIQGHRSGASTEHRPQWQALERRLDDNDVAVVIANDLARFHRRGWRIGQMIARLQSNGIRLLLAAPGRQIDLATPMGQMFVQFIAMADEYYVVDARIRQQDNARRRREKGITTGNPPFATYRGDGGFLERTRRGAWYLPNAQFEQGVPETCPVPGAVWRSYAECALRILILYTTTAMGYEKIAYQLQTDGWPFEDKRDVPRPISGDDVRRVISNWPEYGGLVGSHRAKDRTAAELALLDATEFIEERSLFPTELLRSVAARQRKNKEVYQVPDHGVINDAYPYALRTVLYCIACEQQAHARDDSRLRSTLGGTDQNGIQRYRHKSGVRCGCQARSVRCEIVEGDVVQLLSLLKPRTGVLTQLLKIAVRVGRHVQFKTVDAVAQQQQACIGGYVKLRHCIANTATEFLRRLITCSSWLPVNGLTLQSRYVPSPALVPPFDLGTCVAMLEHLDTLWHMSLPEQRQALAQNLFEYIGYDLDRQRIVDYGLTPWARLFLTATGRLYPDSSAPPTGLTFHLKCDNLF